ncbi:hypothetical protein GCK72_010989 [Caenorhabditis remanei]|uniref:Uncharacterized protein n=1 Tax=Caenorhabditis remanei TaxID=31234 RepID=A0A6A5H6A9_CAERE|nr:hypothetical protein GCK72_010989 [Caenorhabditis remanei]KAF1762727.1 hypothetical protein GCK72_010989 [Caenorhabditis remanei]
MSSAINQVFPRLSAFKCPERGSFLFRATSHNGQSWDFQLDARAQKMVTPGPVIREILESDLFPKYYYISDKFQAYVMFAYNRVSNQHEQFTYCWKTKQLKQVNDLQQTYDPKNDTSEFVMNVYKPWATVVVERAGNGSVKMFSQDRRRLAPAPVTMLVDFDDHDRYIRRLPMYKIRYCHHNQKNVIYVRYKNEFRKFVFNEDTKQLEELKCDSCSVITTDDLYPQYVAESRSLNRDVIFVWNSVTQQIEQYIFNISKMRFEQVQDSKVVYDPEEWKQRIGFIMYNENEEEDVLFGPMISADATLKIGEYSEKLNKVVPVPGTTAVITFFNEEKRKLEEKKKQLEEKKKMEETIKLEKNKMLEQEKKLIGMKDDSDSSGFEDDESIFTYSSDDQMLEENYRLMEYQIGKMLF